jgi:arylsulfatase A-like enzyme
MRSVLIVVFDGLQPSQVTPQLMPDLAERAGRGVTFANHHPVYPTVTRANAASMVTGVAPGGHGIAANTMVFREFDAENITPVLEPQLAQIARQGIPVLLRPTLADILGQQGLEYVAVGVGTSGNAYVHNPRPEVSGGATIHPDFTLPYGLQEDITARFGPWPEATLPNTPRLAHAVRIMTEYILPERQPAVALLWSSEPDKAQHEAGVGSNLSNTALKEADTEFGRVMRWLDESGRADETDVMVISDHGYSTIGEVIRVQDLVREAGFPAADKPGGVAVATNGGSVLFYTREGEPDTAGKLATWLMQQPWCGALTASETALDIPGVLPASLVGGGGPRGPELAMSFRWDSTVNDAGYPGRAYSSGAAPGQGQHGSMSKHELRNVLLAWGPSFKQSVTQEVPSGNVDLAPTVLRLLGLPTEPAMQGRVLEEALATGPDPATVQWSRELRSAERKLENGVYRQQIALSRVGETTYVDQGSGSYGRR